MKAFLLLLSVVIVADISGQVTLQNGSASYDIPIFSFSDAKSGLGTGVALSYSSGNGLVVGSKASNTGQNWNLIAGGSIVRKQNGEADDQSSIDAAPYYFPTYPYTQYLHYNHTIAVYDENTTEAQRYVDEYFPNGFMYSEFPNLDFFDGPQQETHATPRELALIPRFSGNMNRKWKLSRRALTDRMQDVFMYNFNGISGEFVLGRDGNPLLINDAKLVIEKSISNLTGQGIRTRINEFTIKDAGGTIYKFSSYELSNVMNQIALPGDGFGTTYFRMTKTTDEPTGDFTIQKWLLTEIINPITQEKIIFEYENYSIDIIGSKIPSYQNAEATPLVQTTQLHEQRIMGQLKRLKNILLPDGHKVELFYNTILDRVDVPGDYTLKQIKISYNNEEVNSFNLAYGYFVKKEVKNYTDLISEADKRFARLCLTSVQKTGFNISEPAYKFNYYTGAESTDPKNIVPSFDCLAQDHWGFYNKSSIVNNDDPNPSKEILKDLVTSVAPYRNISDGAAKLGLLKSAETPFGGKLTFEYEQNESKDSDYPSSIVAAGGVRVSKTIISDGISSDNDIVSTYNYKVPDGSTSGWGYESPIVSNTPTFLNRRQIKIWNYSDNQYKYEGLIVNDKATSTLKLGTTKFLNKAFTKAAPGIGLPSLGFFNPATIIASIVIGGVVEGLFDMGNPTDYRWTNSYSYYPVESQNPIGINYSRVEVLNTSVSGGTGRVVSEFTAPASVRAEIPAFVMPFSPKQRFPGWKYGLPSKTTIYNQAGTIIKEIINSYNIISNPVISENHKSTKVEAIRPESAWCWVGINSNNLPVTDLSWQHFYPIIGRAELTSSIEKNYSSTGVLSQTEVTNTYNTDYFDNVATTTKSNGDVVKVKKYYTNDYDNISIAIQEMKTRNMIAVPISTETWLIKPNGTEYLLDATINQFDVLATGEIKIKKVYKLITKQPLLKSIIGEQSRTVLVRNSTYFKEQLTFNYDASGNPTETVTPELRVNSKIYDYNNRIVTAEIVNAAQSEVAYTSFETEQTGGWVYDNINSVVGDVVTGKKYFHFPTLNNPSITKTVNSTKSYILSFWQKGTGAKVTNNSTSVAAPIKTIVNSVTGWIYKEYNINNPGTISILNDDNVDIHNINIDELRLYPKDARMATVAYDPKVGKIAECDVNNRLLYYQYDGLGRLKIVRDDKKNILKMLCYNYAGEAENCISSLSAVWTSTGNIRCKPCSINPVFYANIVQHEEKDLNSLSDTYNQLRWVDDGQAYCETSNSWQATGNTICNLDVNGVNNGYQEVEQININPCSQYYNSTNWVVIYNPSACPPGGGGGGSLCNGVECSGDDKKCINGVCETGTWSVVSGTATKVNGVKIWTCTWRYCFSDASQSTYSQVTSGTTPCLITCF